MNVNESETSDGTLYIAKSRFALTMVDIDSTGEKVEKTDIIQTGDSMEMDYQKSVITWWDKRAGQNSKLKILMGETPRDKG